MPARHVFGRSLPGPAWGARRAPALWGSPRLEGACPPEWTRGAELRALWVWPPAVPARGLRKAHWFLACDGAVVRLVLPGPSDSGLRWPGQGACDHGPSRQSQQAPCGSAGGVVSPGWQPEGGFRPPHPAGICSVLRHLSRHIPGQVRGGKGPETASSLGQAGGRMNPGPAPGPPLCSADGLLGRAPPRAERGPAVSPGGRGGRLCKVGSPGSWRRACGGCGRSSMGR